MMSGILPDLTESLNRYMSEGSLEVGEPPILDQEPKEKGVNLRLKNSGYACME